MPSELMAEPRRPPADWIVGRAYDGEEPPRGDGAEERFASNDVGGALPLTPSVSGCERREAFSASFLVDMPAAPRNGFGFCSGMPMARSAEPPA